MPRRTTKKAAAKKSVKRGRPSKKTSRLITVNFEGVESGGGSNVPEGDYAATVASVEQYTAQSGFGAIKWVFEITEGRHKGKRLYYNTSLQEQALWNLRSTLDALGFETPESSYDIDLDEVEGAEAGISVTIEEYTNDKGDTVDQSRISDIFSRDDLDGSGDDEENEEDEGEEEEGDEETEEEGEEGELSEEDVMSASLGDLEDIIESYELDVNLKSKRTLGTRRQLVLDTLIEEGYIEEQ